MRFIICAVVFAALLTGTGCEKKKSTDDLIGDLKTGNERDRMVAVRTLPVNAGDAARVVPALIDSLKDKHSDIRLSAAIKLGSFGEAARDAIPALQIALKDRDARVREAAGTAISRIDPSVSLKLTAGDGTDKSQ